MIFTWSFSLISFLALLGVGYLPFFQTQGLDPLLLFSLLLMSVTPWMIYVIAAVRDQAQISYSFGSLAACIGYISMFILIGLLLFLEFSFSQAIVIAVCIALIYFPIESRIFFVGAFGSLIVTIVSLLVDLPLFSDSASVILYYLLVLGVVSEITNNFFLTWHQNSRKIFHISSSFVLEYRQAVREYTWTFSYIVAIAFVVLLGMQSIGYYIQYEILPFFVFGFWILFGISLLMQSNIRTLPDIFREDISLLSRWFSSDKQIYTFIALCVAFAIDITFFIQLPFWMQGICVCVFFISTLLIQCILHKLSQSVFFLK